MEHHKVLKRSPLLVITITILAIVTILATVSVLSNDSPQPVDVQNTPVKMLVVTLVRDFNVTDNLNATVEDGSPCLPYGAVGPWETEGPYLLVSDLIGRVIGVGDIRQGWWETRPEGYQCVVRVEMSVRDVPFYTFAVANVYTRTVLRSVLVDAGWQYEIVADVR